MSEYGICTCGGSLQVLGEGTGVCNKCGKQTDIPALGLTDQGKTLYQPLYSIDLLGGTEDH
jgi:hypothetical protein